MRAILGFLLLVNLIGCSSKTESRYVIETEVGDITLEVYQEKAPITVGNFLKYVEQAKFDGAYFYRVVRLDNQPINPVKIEVIQGDFTGRQYYFPVIAHETTLETGLTHKDGTVSMGRFDVGTTAAEFFICINDQPELNYGGKRNPDGQGFAAFGQVIDGMDVVRKIQAGETDSQMLKEKIKIKGIYALK
ncbi:peptidylprolyl isomerase [Spongiimicrobium sp. 3-5]|uniref:peptidylprolyl isomerase n=1 Tax=Spongiimicrobium sp. 3-5 TaxID=3332596 RepID=UPI0039815A3A